MKLPELLKLAVEEQNWLKVCAVYTAITGEKLSPPQPKPKKVSLLELEIPDELLEEVNATRNDDDDEEEEYDELPTIPIDSDEIEEAKGEESLIIDVDPEPEEVEVSKKKGSEDEFAISHGLQNQTSSSDGNGTIMRKVPIGDVKGKRPNKFRDNLAVEAGDLKKNNPILKKVYGKVGSRASRDLIEAPDTSKLYAVQCSLCGKKQKVTAVLSKGYHKEEEQNTYRCNECNTPTGRARVARRERE